MGDADIAFQTVRPFQREAFLAKRLHRALANNMRRFRS